MDIQLGHCVAQMKVDRGARQSQDLRHILSVFSVGRPLQNLSFTRAQMQRNRLLVCAFYMADMQECPQ
ncbi:hypothetical protein D3C77_728140 [compost metagenome]